MLRVTNMATVQNCEVLFKNRYGSGDQSNDICEHIYIYIYVRSESYMNIIIIS